MRLSGFTLFHHPGKGWQLSTREYGEDGWVVRTSFPDDKAQKILRLVGELVPDGPPQVELPVAEPGALDLRPRKKRVIL